MEYKTTKKYSKKVIDEIFRIHKEKGLTAENLLKEAKKKSNPLHSLFRWDDKEAAYLWRLQQARVIINEVKIIVEDKEYYAFENVRVEIKDGKGQREYKLRDEILKDDSLRTQVVESAYNQLLYWKSKYEDYKEFEPVFEAIKKIGDNLNAKESRT